MLRTELPGCCRIAVIHELAGLVGDSAWEKKAALDFDNPDPKIDGGMDGVNVKGMILTLVDGGYEVSNFPAQRKFVEARGYQALAKLPMAEGYNIWLFGDKKFKLPTKEKRSVKKVKKHRNSKRS